MQLLEAILDSRKGQAELSAVLGERVREAVELLVQSHGEALRTQCADVDPAEIYRAAARVTGQTGVEMEALTAVAVACLTIYDMAKAIDRGMVIGGVRLVEKRGGKSGVWRLPRISGRPPPVSG